MYLVALDEVTEAFAKEVLDALVESELARLVRDVDRPVDRRSKTFEPEDLWTICKSLLKKKSFG